MPSVFLSYNWQDKVFVSILAKKLREAGIDVWIDETKINIGDSIIEKIGQGIKESDFLAVVLSKNSISSPWVKQELKLAMTKEIQDKNITVLPIRLDKEIEIPSFLIDKVYADFSDERNFNQSLLKLIQAIENRYTVRNLVTYEPLEKLHVVWIVDVSRSMGENGKIQALNIAMAELIPHLKKASDENPSVDILVSCIKFWRGAEWVEHRGTHLREYKWEYLKIPPYPHESTDMGTAFYLLADYLKYLPNYGLPPFLVLLSDGKPTDDFFGGLNTLLAQPWGKAASRVSIAIGRDTDFGSLQAFISSPERRSLEANNIDLLKSYIKWTPITI